MRTAVHACFDIGVFCVLGIFYGRLFDERYCMTRYQCCFLEDVDYTRGIGNIVVLVQVGAIEKARYIAHLLSITTMDVTEYMHRGLYFHHSLKQNLAPKRFLLAHPTDFDTIEDTIWW